MIEKRTNSRVRTLRSASIIFGGASTVDCVVRNLSETGACLEVASPVGIPDDFALQIKPEERKRDCHVAWRPANRRFFQLGAGGMDNVARTDAEVAHGAETVSMPR